MSRRTWLFLGGLLLLTGPAFFLSLYVGPVSIPVPEIGAVLMGGDVSTTANLVVWELRLPRAIGAFLVGGSLSLAGLALQGLFRNPLAAPGVIGVSSGGAFGAILVIILGIERTGWVTAGAFVMALVTVYVVFRLATRRGRTPVTSLLLAGLAVGAFHSAMIGLAMTLVDPYRLNRLLFWLLGGLDGLRWENVLASLVPLVVGVSGLGFTLKELDLLSQGEPTARSMGVHVGWLKGRVLFWVSLLTATAVSITGVIGFVGLIVPHVTRMFVGPNHRRMAPVVFVAGGTFLLLADVFSRWVIQPAEVRIGIITALMGVPFFLYLLRRRSLGWSDQP